MEGAVNSSYFPANFDTVLLEGEHCLGVLLQNSLAIHNLFYPVGQIFRTRARPSNGHPTETYRDIYLHQNMEVQLHSKLVVFLGPWK